jgi:hypothetical protein
MPYVEKRLILYIPYRDWKKYAWLDIPGRFDAAIKPPCPATANEICKHFGLP